MEIDIEKEKEKLSSEYDVDRDEIDDKFAEVREEFDEYAGDDVGSERLKLHALNAVRSDLYRKSRRDAPEQVYEAQTSASPTIVPDFEDHYHFRNYMAKVFKNKGWSGKKGVTADKSSFWTDLVATYDDFRIGIKCIYFGDGTTSRPLMSEKLPKNFRTVEELRWRSFDGEQVPNWAIAVYAPDQPQVRRAIHSFFSWFGIGIVSVPQDEEYNQHFQYNDWCVNIPGMSTFPVGKPEKGLKGDGVYPQKVGHKHSIRSWVFDD